MSGNFLPSDFCAHLVGYGNNLYQSLGHDNMSFSPINWYPDLAVTQSGKEAFKKVKNLDFLKYVCSLNFTDFWRVRVGLGMEE